MTILISDSFNRDDNATTLNSTDSYNGGTSTPWIYQDGGTWGIKNKQAYQVMSGTSAYAYDIAVVQSNESNVNIETDVVWASGSSAGLTFRNSDNANWYDACVNSSGLTLRKLENNSYSILGTYAFAPIDGKTYHIEAILDDDNISISLNGIQQITVTDAFNKIATLHGLRNPSIGSYFDNFQISQNINAVGMIELSGTQELSVNLNGMQELNVTLKGEINMTLRDQNVRMFAGESKNVGFNITDVTDLTGVTFSWQVKKSEYTATSIFEKTTFSVNGTTVIFPVSPDDTQNLSGELFHKVKMVDASGNVSFPSVGKLIIDY